MENPTFLADDYDGDKVRQDTINHNDLKEVKTLKKSDKENYEPTKDKVQQDDDGDDKILKEENHVENKNDKPTDDLTETATKTNKKSVDNSTLTPIELAEVKSNEIGIDNKININDDDDDIEILEVGSIGTQNTSISDARNTEPATENNDKNTETSLSTNHTSQHENKKDIEAKSDLPHKNAKDFHDSQEFHIQEEKFGEGINAKRSEKAVITTQNIDMNELSLKDKNMVQRTISSHISDEPPSPNRDSKKPFKSLKYGWGRVTPKFLKFMNKPVVFIILLSNAGEAQGLVVTGVSFTILTSIEKQFGFSSSHVGLFGTVYDGGFGVLCVVVGFLGHRNKPRWIGAGMIVMAAGAVLLSVPKYIIGGYHAGIQRDTDFCRYTQGLTYIPECGGSSPWYYTMIFLGGNIIMGIGATPLYVLGPAHIDEITTRGQNGLYNGVFAMSAALGPAIGFIIGLPILNTWVDIEEVSLRFFFSFTFWISNIPFQFYLYSYHIRINFSLLFQPFYFIYNKDAMKKI